MNDDYDALLYFDKANITAHVLQAINEFSRFASGKVSWEELPQIVQYFFPREVLCQMREAIAHITVGDMESYLRHFEAFSRNAIKAYSPKISVLTQNTLKFACFSDTITSANMWGHYASSSTGFSIGYNFRGFPSAKCRCHTYQQAFSMHRPPYSHLHTFRRFHRLHALFEAYR